MPFVRTFAPIVAGAVEMDYRRFFFFNLLGGLLWAAGFTIAGYYLGQSFPPEVLDKYFLVILAVVIFVSALPAMIHAWKEYRHEVWDAIVKRWKGLRAKSSETIE
jgi:membrane-associated protein